MFLPLEHKKLNLYAVSKKIVYSCHELTHNIVSEEKGFISEQVRKAALIAHTNIIKGLYTKKKKRKRRFFKTAMKAYVLVDAGLEMVLELRWATADNMVEIEKDLQKAFNNLRKKRKK
ncbi:MAG TPA: four helix bundle protein [Flavisolibacter sp.]|nr:four helix bundle protein [Flavisolibacter sp.]